MLLCLSAGVSQVLPICIDYPPREMEADELVPLGGDWCSVVVIAAADWDREEDNDEREIVVQLCSCSQLSL